MPQDNFQLTDAAARKYQAHSVPAMFAPLAEATLEKITLTPDAHIIDIACGTGALTRLIARDLPGRGRVVGTDLNATMLDVAREMQPETPHEMHWEAADVTALPFDDDTFNMGFIQQGLQFFPDKPAALAEVRRILKPGGQLILTCWRAISPFNNALAEALAMHVSDKAAEKARAPFSFRDGGLITQLLQQAGFTIDRLDGVILHRRFEDLGAQILALPVESDMRTAGEEATQAVITEAANRLMPYNQAGVFIVPQEAHLFVARTGT